MAVIREAGLPQGDRVPPQNVELEMCVLGAVMLEPREAFSIAADYLSRDSFYLDGHGIIFELMGELHRRGIPPDSVAVLDELRARSAGLTAADGSTTRGATLLEKVGGSGVLMAMLNAVPTAANVEYHARKVADKAHLRNLIRGCTHIIDECYRQEQPLEQILDLAESTVLRLSARSNTGEFISIGQVLKDYWEKLDERELKLREMRASGEVNPRLSAGLNTGFYDLDKITGGLRDSELTIIAARPSVGKTALALNFAHNLSVMQNIPVAVFSLEMGAEQLAERLLCMGTKYLEPGTQRVRGIMSNRLQNPNLSDQEWNVLRQSFERLSQAPIFLDDSSMLTSTMLKAKARRLASKYNIGCIIVDYLQLMSGASVSDNRVQEVSEISRGLKQIARELKIPVIALSQLSRSIESRQTKRPHLSDLRESGAIEQDADVVMFIHREDYYNQDKRGGVSDADWELVRLPEAEIIVSKNRNGPTDSVKLLWFKEITRFLDSAGR